MKKTFLIFVTLVLLATTGTSQTIKSQISATADTLWRFLKNNNSSGTATFGFITGADTVFVQGDGTTLRIIADFLKAPIILMDTNQIKQVDTAVDTHDAVPFFQMLDSIISKIGAVTFWTELAGKLYPVDTTNKVGIKTIDPLKDFDVNGDINSLANYYQYKKPRALVTFQFDDGNDTPLMDGYKAAFDAQGEVGCLVIPTDYVDSVYQGIPTMNWVELQSYQTDGWEIVNHTKTHPDLRTLTESQIISEFELSDSVFKSYGINVNNLVYPGHYTNRLVKEVSSKYFRSARGGNLVGGIERLGVNRVVFKTFEVKSLLIGNSPYNFTAESLKDSVDVAVAGKKWLIIYTHADVAPLGYNVDSLNKVIDYIQSLNVPIVTQNQAIDMIGNMITVGENFHVNERGARLDTIWENIQVMGSANSTGGTSEWIRNSSGYVRLKNITDKVIIGSGVPGAPLTVVNTTSGADIFRFTNSVGTYALNNYQLTTPSSFLISASGGGYIDLNNTNGNIRLLGAGGVLIGRTTTAAANKLDVNGSVAIGTYAGVNTATTGGLIMPGKLGAGMNAPTAFIHIKAGTTAAGTGPLKFTSGPLLTVAEPGLVEFDTDAWYGTISTGSVRKQFAFTSDIHNPITLAAIGSTPNANGMTLSTQVLNLEPASASFGGVVTTGAQTFAGAKTFSSQVTSTLPIGTSPFEVISTTLNTNLNSDLWDSHHYSDLTDSLNPIRDTLYKHRIDINAISAKIPDTLKLAGDISAAWLPNATGTTTIGDDKVTYRMLNDNVISGQTELTTGIEAVDEILISDASVAGQIKRMKLSVLGELGLMKKSVTSLTSIQVSDLGTKKVLIAAPGAGYYIKVLGISVKLVNNATNAWLDTHQLQFGYTSTGAAQTWGSLNLYAYNTGTYNFHVQPFGLATGGSLYVDMKVNEAFNIGFGDGNDPPAGTNATMRITVNYTIEEY